MKKHVFHLTLAAFVCGSLVFTSCNRNQESAAPAEEAVEDNNFSFGESEDAVGISEAILDDPANAGSLRESGETRTFTGLGGATITITPKGSNATGSVVIDFGTGVTYNGKTRKGKVLVTYTDRRRVSGAVRTVSFDNYFVNDNKVEGAKTVTFSSDISAESLVFNAAINSSLKVTTAAGRTILWNSQRTRIYDTKGTEQLADDEVTLSGTANGTNRKGVTFDAAITTPLVIKVSCVPNSGWLPTSGVLEITPAGVAKRTVNYGNGNCDRTVTVTVGERTFEVVAR